MHSTKKFSQKCAQKKCAEMCAQNLCRNCAHKNVQKMCTHKMCRIVHTHKMCKSVRGEFCADLSWGSFRQCVRRVVSENCVDEKFPVMHIRKFYAREHCPTCVQKVFAMCARRFAQIVHVRKCAQTVTCAKCQKWPKNDQKWPKSTIWPKCPKMAQNGPKWQKMSRVGTWLVTGPLRLVTQGGKSCQNMH